jgi:tetratricopeptide (TPR) repeat protein
MLMGEHKRAREYLSKTVAIQDNYQGARSLNGWIELTCGSEVKAKKANDMFKEAQEKYPNDIDAYIGQATFLEQVKKDVKGAINVLTTCAVKFSWFTPSESERARLLLAMKEWDLAAESANKALQLDPNNIQALSLTITILLVRDSKYSTASSRLAELAELIHETEPHNAQLCHDTAALFARLCARQGTLLAQCLDLMTKATQLAPKNSQFMAELGYQQLLARSYDKAFASYTEAYRLDEANMAACYGKITAQVLRGGASDLEEARQQFEFLNEIHGGSGASSDLCYIGALVAASQGGSEESAVRQLEETARVHLEAAGLDDVNQESLSEIVVTPELLIQLNPDFLAHLARMMLESAGSSPAAVGEPPSPLVAKALEVCVESPEL